MKVLDDAEVGSIERVIHVDATPEVVYDVVSNPEHVAVWWPDEADYEPVAGADGTITFGDPAQGGHRARLSVVEAISPRTFSFRWTHEDGEEADADNSFLVTFTLSADGEGTRLHMVETGFRERGWEAAQVEETYLDHVSGWNHFLPQIAPYAVSLAARP